MIPLQRRMSSFKYQLETQVAAVKASTATNLAPEPQEDAERQRAAIGQREMARLALRHGRYSAYKALRGAGADSDLLARKGRKRARPGRLPEVKPQPRAQDAEAERASLRELRKLLDAFDDPSFQSLFLDRLRPSIWPEAAELLREIKRREQAQFAAYQERIRADPSLLLPAAPQSLPTLQTQQAARPRLPLQAPALTSKERDRQALFELYRAAAKLLVRHEKGHQEHSPRSQYMLECARGEVTPEPLVQLRDGPSIEMPGRGLGNRHAAPLAAAFAAASQLRVVDLADNGLNGPSLNVLLRGLASQRLRTLNLSGNELNDAAAGVLGDILSVSRSLRHLSLNSAKLKPSELALLCDGIRRDGCTLRSLHLADNGIGHRGAEHLGRALEDNTSIHTLNLGWNSISGGGAEELLLGLKTNRVLQTLDLRWNLLASAVKALGEALASNCALTHLDLSYNHLDAAHCTALGEQLDKNHTLLGLHMTGNAFRVAPSGHLVPRDRPLKDTGGAHHLRAKDPTKSICLRQRLGYKPSRETVAANPGLATFKTRQSSLASAAVALGQSGSMIARGSVAKKGAAAATAAAATPKKRTRIFKSFRSAVIAVSALTRSAGAAGRAASGDARLAAARRDFRTEKLKTDKHLATLTDPPSIVRDSDAAAEDECAACWVCGKWRQVRLEFVDVAAAEEVVVRQVEDDIRRREEAEQQRLRLKNNPSKARVKRQVRVRAKTPPPLKLSVLLSCDGFSHPRPMQLVKGDFRYEVFVMLPPGVCEFFFLLDGRRPLLGPNQRTLVAAESTAASFSAFVRGRGWPGGLEAHAPQTWNAGMRGGKTQKQDGPRPKPPGSAPPPLRLHALQVLERREPWLPNDLLARPRRGGWASKSLQRRKAWTREDGVFGKFPVETTDFMIRAFRADVRHGKFERLVKDEDERHDMLMVLQENYNLLRVAYTLFCANSIGNSVSSVSWSAFTDLCAVCEIADARCTTADLDNIFVATNVNDEAPKAEDGKDLNPDRDLCRFEFVEIMARIAIHKYCTGQSPVTESPSEAVRMLIDEHLITHLDIESPQIFRERFLWNKRANDIYMVYLPVLQCLFNRVADANMNRKNKRMTVHGWKLFLVSAGLLGVGGCSERDAKLSYRLAMTSVVDEMTDANYTTIDFVSFLEALGRVAYLSDLNTLERFVRSLEETFEGRSGSSAIPEGNAASNSNSGSGSDSDSSGDSGGESSSEGDEDDEDDEDDEGGQGRDKSFYRRLTLGLRLLIWHPAIYDRAGKKSKLRRERSHMTLLGQRHSIAVPSKLRR